VSVKVAGEDKRRFSRMSLTRSPTRGRGRAYLGAAGRAVVLEPVVGFALGVGVADIDGHDPAGGETLGAVGVLDVGLEAADHDLVERLQSRSMTANLLYRSANNWVMITASNSVYSGACHGSISLQQSGPQHQR
jgi:hypothetical protein